MALLHGYDWPGNVRELENVIERAVALTSNRFLSVEDLPARIREGGHGHPAAAASAAGGPVEMVSLRDVEKRHILQVLRALGGNKTRAAEVLGISRRTLIRVAQRFGLGAEMKEE